MSPPFAWLIAAVLSLSACASTSSDPTRLSAQTTRAVLTADLGSITSVSIEGRVWLSGVPQAPDLGLAQRRGIACVIDLRKQTEMKSSTLAQDCEQLGVRYLAMHPGEGPLYSDPFVDQLVLSLRELGGQSVLLVGANPSKVAPLLAVHRIVNERVKVGEALAEARMCGMKPGEPETFVRRQAARKLNALGS